MKKALVVAAVCFAATPARAQSKTDAQPDPAPPVEEVSVRVHRAPKPAKTTFGAGEIRQVPGAFGDPFRVMETVPGVTPIISGLPFFFVRGAPPGNNGYYLDGIRVPLLYHIGFGPSAIHPGLISRVDFYPGGPPARFGRFVGGLLVGETRPETYEFHGEGNVRVFDAGALVEAPFADGRGSVLLGGRYSYTAALVSLVAPSVKLDYWDYQARIAYAVTPDDTLSVFAFGSKDFLGQQRTAEVAGQSTDKRLETIFSTQFHRLDLRWDRRLPHRGRLRIAATLGTDSTATEDLQGVRDRMVATRLYVEQPIGSNVLLRGGVDANLDHYDLARAEGTQSASSLYPPRNDIALGAHLDAVMRITNRWEVTPGIRVDYFGSVRSLDGQPDERSNLTNAAVPAVDPRLQSRIQLAERVSLVSSFAITHQTPSFFVPVPGLQIGRLAQGLQTGVQESQGLELGLPLGFTFTPTAFHHEYTGLNDFFATCGDVNAQGKDDCVDRRVRGRTIGAEFLLRRSLNQRLTGWIAYTLSRTTRTTELFLFGRSGAQAEIPGDFDRTHVLNVIGAYDLGVGWRVGARFFFYTGRPYSRRALDIPVPPYNDQRMPAFYRFDARVEKQWRLGNSARISLVLEWLNFTFQKEVTSVSCRTSTRPRAPDDLRRIQSGDVPPALLDTCTFDELGPVAIPSIGVEGAF